ncbi:MAG: ribbon-helix-helix domain-containing protein [Thermoanaerobaculia bacterium]
MATTKIAITLDEDLLDRIDRMVAEGRFPSRSRAIQVAVRAQIDRVDGGRLARECAKLDPRLEQALAEEAGEYGLDSWPEY